MIKNYFKIAVRNIKRYAVHSVLNISGMAIGMACAILILLWVYDEWSYDRCFKNSDNLYRVIENQFHSTGKVTSMIPTPGILAQALKEEYPEITRGSRFVSCPLTLKKGDEFIEESVVCVDKDFVKMFDIKFVHGDINTALNDPHNIIITEETAHKYFGKEDVIGKTIESRGYNVTVTGVVKQLPHNSHLSFEFLVPIEWLTGGHINDWGGRFHTYIELKNGTDEEIINKKIRNYIRIHHKELNSEIFLQNIKKIHLYSSGKYIYDVSDLGDIAYVRIMAIIAVFILLIACINFINLSTAQSVRRSREIGVRKAAGASRQKIIIQFLGESLLIVFVAHVIAMIIAELLLPGYNHFVGKHLEINYHSAGLYVSLIVMILFCSLLAGSYPAFYMSSLKTIDTLKEVIHKKGSSSQFRRVLVVFQFSLTVLMIISTLMIGKQLRFIQNKNLGFNKDNVGYFMFPIRPGDPKLESLKKELGKNPEIINVTMGENPINNEWTSGGFNWSGKKVGDDILFHFLGVDDDYAKTFQIELKQGRFFSSEFPSDNTAVILNEEAVKTMGFKNPVGEILTTPNGSKLSVIGVMKNFHFQSLHNKIGPLIMQLGVSNNFRIRMKPDHIPSTVEFIDKTFKSFNPGLPLDFHFLSDDFDKLYRTEQRMSKIFDYFSLLAIIISCLGLIGLSTFMIEHRTKEIGIRKANGAKSTEILSLLSKEYIVLVISSFLIASPIAWYVMHKWLQNFAYRTNMSWWLFALAGIMVMIITMLTVGFQSYKAAHKNPVDALRYE
jgi:putative ABC transport system permease protein